ncbi:endonuclease/exonuclease/phosphatase family protein [Carboxylicivirga sp. A043]|uniref:endonuclease/exonuclease/phosphatase family protein n=1 Tax=Carboxylicivirga litoralis TaxID=2816963 RepID=UPI0021CB423C|nr:endonuclease/exonuclease/phosphatase family protein [Carboxylicivirga sp. A043]MCU4157051.1 endonuclease/exonuclease/phosphatase family protein [Carboxylicivirga sp. A043]
MKTVIVTLSVLCLISLVGCQQSIGLKIMSYNIRHGEGLDNELDLSRSGQVIKSEAPHLCALQEVDSYCRRSDSVNQTNYLAQYTSMTGTFGKFMDFDGGEYGMATLSSKPLLSTKVLQLPNGLHEPRSAIVHEVEIAKACTIVFVNVHFDWLESEEGVKSRLSQARALMRYINTTDKAVVIAGDFNCTSQSPTMQYFAEQGFVLVDKGEDNLSFQGEGKAEIDHVIYRNAANLQVKVKECYLLNEPIVSDHRPLVAALEIIY